MMKITFIVLLLAPLAFLHAAEVTNLRCEYLKDPLGMDAEQPRLSWKIEDQLSVISNQLSVISNQLSVERGLRQAAYQVLVASSEALLKKDTGDLWDSGKVERDQSVNVKYAGKPLESRRQCYWKVRVWFRGQGSAKATADMSGVEGSGWSSTAQWTMGLLKVDDWSAKWITMPDQKRLVHPWLRRTFELKEGVERAVMYVNTASYYELHINGKKVGPYVLEPGITQVNKRFIVNAYNVTSFLVKGTNTIALWMGPGWYQPKMGNTNNAPILRAQLDVDTHSAPLVIGTDASWRVKESCITQIGKWSWNNFGGERFDAGEFIKDWDQVGLDDSQWAQALEIPAPSVAHSWQGCESARLSEPLKPVEIRRLQNNKWVIDFGRPLTGWMRLKMHKLKAGQEVQINYADIDDNRNARKLAFMVNADGFQDFNQMDIFISAGKSAETFCSRFNFHSFRYAVIAGLDSEPSINDAEAMMIEPDLATAGSFECSNELFNRIHEITRYTLRTQNPCLALGTGEAREKSAYGDGGAHLSGYLYNFKCDANLRKWIRDYSDAQRDDGWFTHTAPAFEDHGGGPAWGGEVSELVRRMHLYYGDKGTVEQMYDKLRKFVDFIETKTHDDILRSFTPTKREEAWMFIGDWARPAATAAQGFNMDKKDEREFFNNSYRVLLWQQLQDFATGIGRTDEARRCGERLAVIRPLVHKTFYQVEKGTYLFSSQSSLAMALYARIPPPELRPKIMAQLENMIVVEKKGHLDTGLLGTFVLLDLLIQENRNDLVSLIMEQTTYPGWGYLVKELGLKTWPETWSGWGSHVILVTATPGSWFFEGLAGIRPDPAAPGFKHFTLRPGIVKSVDWVTCSYQSPYGKIVSNWKCEGEKLTMEVVIPANTTATIHVPTRDAAGVTESGRPTAKADGVKFLRMENGAAVYEVGSGTYQFLSATATAILCFKPTATAAASSIVRDGETIQIKAGALERVIRVSGGNVATERLTVSGTSLIEGKAHELSFRIMRAVPNRNPLEMPLEDSVTAVSVAESKANDTDALKVSGQAKRETQATAGQGQWRDARTFTAAAWGDCFDLATVAVAPSRPGMQRVVIRGRSLKDPVLAGVSVNLIYEVYAGYPVIRKWVEIHNNSANWLKVDNLLTDDIKLGNSFVQGAELTPSERGATSSIIAFVNPDNTQGVMVASEVPSALRNITKQGASGYTTNYFEWVIGPAESFVSEPSFLYGFSGDVIKTVSAASLPLDRAVEGGFKDFLREHLGVSPAHVQIPAPLWCSWSNFGHLINDALIREQADIASKCGFALLQIDDGWQKDRLGITPDAKTFPDFDATCAYIRSKGLRLGLWVSCFRSRDAGDFKALPKAAISPEVQRLDGVAMSFASSWNTYYANDLAFLHDRYGATYFKQDFSNIQFGDLAVGHHSRTRKESLLRGLRGLLESQALLRHLAPDVANEITHEIYWGTPGTPCDLAALKNVSLYHVPPNDYSGCGHFKERPNEGWSRYGVESLNEKLRKGCMNARIRFYAHRGLPLECIEYYGAATVNWKGSLTPHVQDRQICSWLMGSPSVYAGDLASLTEENIARYRNRFDMLKRLETTYGIYRHFQYSGVPAPTDTDWHWWGKLDALGCGAVVVLRGSGGAEARAVNIPWVNPSQTYTVTTLFDGKQRGKFTGKQLQAGELTLALPVFGQEIIELTTVRAVGDSSGQPASQKATPSQGNSVQ